MHKNQGPVYYGDYLQLNKLLECQTLLSKKYETLENGECHDEMLFILVHQVYELWFKQILHEINSMIEIFQKKSIIENELSIILERLNRIKKIQTLLLSQLDVMETMTPMDFLEFRNLLIPASGFQSTQFREIEIKLGLGTNDRIDVDREFFLGRLNQADKDRLNQLENTPSILKLIEAWLERTPFTDSTYFNFWEEYKNAVDNLLDEEEKIIFQNSAQLNDRAKNIQIENLTLTKKTFQSLFDKNMHEDLILKKERRLSQKALLNGLFILLYRDESILTLPFQILNSLIDLDENFTTWRHRHALMAHRLLGSKIGTGGSSGHQYLKRAADNNRVFVDLFNLSTFLIPRSKLPILPPELKKQLNFYV